MSLDHVQLTLQDALRHRRLVMSERGAWTAPAEEERRMGAPVVRWQIITPHPDDVCAFYAEVFGWRTARDNPLGVRELRTDATPVVSGSVWPAPSGAPTFVQLFLEVPDVPTAIDEVERRGGSVIVPRSVLPQGEVMAIIRDPFGMSVGLVERAARPSGC